MGDTENLRVAVRVRPFSARETDEGATSIVQVAGNSTSLTDPATGKERHFAFDYSFDSTDASARNYASQELVFDKLGSHLIDNACQGYNVSLFAYGQTGSGKSYTMVGYGKETGMIPRLCESLFDHAKKNAGTYSTFQVEASMIEIYNEHVKDLFNPGNPLNLKGGLRVREHPKTGPYVEDLSTCAVSSYRDINQLMEEGLKARTVAATQMNATSSRAHTLVQIIFTQTKVQEDRKKATDIRSKISLIDLAGSERQSKAESQGDRLREGAMINKSLSCLGNCISALAKLSSADEKNKSKIMVPYRDSVLTFILKESLGGNAKTSMCATISPAASNFDETLSTLRYADRAKQIKTTAQVNMDENKRIINELQAEVERLRVQLEANMRSLGLEIVDDSVAQDELVRLREELEQSEKLMSELNKTWEQKMQQTKEIEESRHQLLSDNGLSVSEMKEVFGVTNESAYLVNLNEDPLMTEALLYFLREGRTVIGKSPSVEIKLSGVEIRDEHCVIINEGGRVMIEALDGATFVNGENIRSRKEPTVLEQNARIIVGNNHFFRFNDPKTARNGPQSPRSGAKGEPELIDWQFAVKELMEKQRTDSAADAEARQAEMEQKIRELEEQMRTEQDKARKVLEEQQKKNEELMAQLKIGKQAASKAELREIERREKELQEQNDALQREINERMHADEQYRQAAWKTMQERRELENQLQRLLPQLREANAMAEKLGKDVHFELRVLNHFPDLSTLSPLESLATLKTFDFAVKVVSGDGQTKSWSVDKFNERLSMMRELYYNVVEMKLEDMREIAPDRNPFYDSPEHQLIGKAFVYLKPLALGSSVEVDASIIDFKGSEEGTVRVKIEHAKRPGKIKTAADLVGKPLALRMTILSADKLPPRICSNTFAAFTFYDDDAEHETRIVEHKTSSPSFQFTHTFNIAAATQDLVHYLEHNALTIRVYGVPEFALEAASLRRQSSRDLLSRMSGDRGTSFKIGQAGKKRKGSNKSLMDNRASMSAKRGLTDIWEFTVWIEVQEQDEHNKLQYVTLKKVKMHGGKPVSVFRLHRSRDRRMRISVEQNAGPFPALESIAEIRLGRSLGPFDQDVDPAFTEPFVMEIDDWSRRDDDMEASCVVQLTEEDLEDLGLNERTPDGEYRQLAIDIDVELCLADQPLTSFSELVSVKMYNGNEKLPNVKESRGFSLFRKKDEEETGRRRRAAGSRYRTEMPVKQVKRRREWETTMTMENILQAHEKAVEALRQALEDERANQIGDESA